MSWFHSRSGSVRRSAARGTGSRWFNPRRKSRPPLALELLEGRTLLSVYTVDRLTDAGEGDGLAGDLRYAITQAADGDSVQFAVQGTLNLTRALPDLTQSISIEGPGADLLTVRRDTGGSYRIFRVAGGTAVSIAGLTIANGFAPISAGSGGGISNDGTLTVSGSTVSGNGAGPANGGGIYNSPSGTLTVSNSTIAGNRALEGLGGGIYNVGALTVSSSTFSGNSAGGGGGIFTRDPGTLTVSDSTFASNRANNGGAIQGSGTLVVSNSTFSGNQAVDGPGGAIWNNGTLSMLTVSNSTLSGNSSRFFGGAISNGGTLTVSNSTVSGNSSRDLGGGIYNVGALTVSNSTIAGNQAGGGQLGGGIFTSSAGTLNMRNTILAGNSAFHAADLSGNLASSGYNLIGNTEGGSGYADTDLLNVDPLLGPLQDNGGPTQTMALLPGSPAIDAGDNTDAPDFDQRGEGFPRIVNDVIDIGAFEVQDKPRSPSAPPRGKPFRLDVVALIGVQPARPVSSTPSDAKPHVAGVDAVFSNDSSLPLATSGREAAVAAALHRLRQKESQSNGLDWAEVLNSPLLLTL